jgi:hypothetical protein
MGSEASGVADPVTSFGTSDPWVSGDQVPRLGHIKPV